MSPVKDDALQLEKRVEETIRSYSLMKPGDTVLVAVSGGADSVALLLLLCHLAPAFACRVAVAHFEHGIRGADSLEDMNFVRALCAQLDVPCHIGHGDVPALAEGWKTSVEDAARRARYAFFDEIIADGSMDVLALAHQREDQAETLLLHLVHGSGLQGLSGMRYQSGNRIRPLLGEPRAALEAYLRARGQAWREDATNGDIAYSRNLLRHAVFPILRRLNPQAAAAMARTAGIVGEAVDALRAQAEVALAGRVKHMPYGAFCLIQDSWLDAEAMRLFVGEAGVPALSAAQTNALLAIAVGETLNLPGGWHALRTGQRLHLYRNVEPVPLDTSLFSQAPDTPDAPKGDGIHSQLFDADKLEGAAFRYRQNGDTFSPLGMQGTQKLKQTLRDAGIDKPFRDYVPLLAKGSRVLWIVGLKPGRDAAITAQTQRAVNVAYHGSLPWEIDASDDGGMAQ